MRGEPPIPSGSKAFAMLSVAELMKMKKHGSEDKSLKKPWRQVGAWEDECAHWAEISLAPKAASRPDVHDTGFELPIVPPQQPYPG